MKNILRVAYFSFVPALLSPLSAQAADDYVLGPDSEVQPGVPQGVWDEFVWKSTIYPGTERYVAVYAPAQYNKNEPTRFMIFQDGVRQFGVREPNRELRREAQYRVPNVLDNLIHRGELPVILAIFVDPGSDDIRGRNGSPNFSNRSVEYDTVSDVYATFLEREIIPEVQRRGYNLRPDAAGRAIGGISSGGICAFTAAWHRPDLFSKVLSNIGSFVDIRGGYVYPQLVRENPPKPIRVFMQEGSNDNNRRDRPNRSWPEQNLLLAAALIAQGYDFQFVWGDGAHTHRHGASILPESLKWLWREDSPAAAPATRSGANSR